MQKRLFLALLALVFLTGHSHTQSESPRPNAVGTLVPARVASLVVPILDIKKESLEECGAPGVPSRCTAGESYIHEQKREKTLNKRLFFLAHQKGPSVDEALVVLMCFYIGESQEEEDGVIARGQQVLGYLDKYRNKNPLLPGRSYPASMYKKLSQKNESFDGATGSIRHKLRKHTGSKGRVPRAFYLC